MLHGTGSRALLCTLLLGVGLAFPVVADEHELAVVGSDSMAPLLERVAGLARPDLDVRIEGRGSETGPIALLRGEAGLASLTRPLTATEEAGFRARYGRTPITVPVALDAVAVIVNADNPLREISRGGVVSAFGASAGCEGGKPVERWGQLGPPLAESELAERGIGLYAPPPASGTRALFRGLALCGGRLAPRARRQPGTASVAVAIAESPFALGITTLANLSPGVRALALPAAGGSGFAAPTPQEVRSGRYPFSRELVLIALPDEDGRLAGSAQRFIELILSGRGQAEVEAAGFLGLTDDRLAKARSQVGD